MAWRSRGLIFDVRDWSGASAVGAFAQSPQALVLDDRVRVYFSTRTRDTSGEWLSKVAYVDFERDLSAVRGEPVQVAMGPSVLGAFDEHGIFPFSVVSVGDEVWAYTTGWSRRRSVPVETGIGLAVSRDGGASFDRVGTGPVLSASLFEPFLVCDGFVRRHNGRWLMWYLFGTRWMEGASGEDVERLYKIGVATSDDGVSWQPSGGRQAVPDRLDATESQALPSVLIQDAHMQMAFCYRESTDFRNNPDRGYRLGFATSEDGFSWRRDDSVISFPRSSFDSAMRCYPHLLCVNDRTFLLYNGNEFGRWGFGAAEWSM